MGCCPACFLATAVARCTPADTQRLMCCSLQQTVRDKCFKICISSPGTSLSSSDQKCLSRCMDRYSDVSRFGSRGAGSAVRRRSEFATSCGGAVTDDLRCGVCCTWPACRCTRMKCVPHGLLVPPCTLSVDGLFQFTVLHVMHSLATGLKHPWYPARSKPTLHTCGCCCCCSSCRPPAPSRKQCSACRAWSDAGAGSSVCSKRGWVKVQGHQHAQALRSMLVLIAAAHRVIPGSKPL